jgi:hypothetical protein
MAMSIAAPVIAPRPNIEARPSSIRRGRTWPRWRVVWWWVLASSVGCLFGCGTKPAATAACNSALCLPGNSCVDGQCSLLCTQHGDCPENLGYSCEPGTADDGGGQKLVCRPGAVPRTAGGYGTSCGLHLDADCDTSAGFVCLGKQNDADAFCSKPGACTTDVDCPQAMYCGASRRLGCVSATSCATAADCVAFPATTCADDGAGAMSCLGQPGCHIDSTDCPTGAACQALPGQTTKLALIRACVPRGYCAPCQTVLDCADTNAACVLDRKGAGFCSRLCQPGGTSCDPGASCQSTPQGNTCVPKGGTCQGDASPCSACRDDSDCGSQGICNLVEETGERYCIEPCQGTTCPNAPGGEPMDCCTDPAGCGQVLNDCLPRQFPNAYPRFATGCWLQPCQINGDCPSGELCDIRSETQVSNTELVTACGTVGVCRAPHDPSDAIDFPITQRVCNCSGNNYLSEADLAEDPSVAFKGCCSTVVASNGAQFTCAPATQ